MVCETEFDALFGSFYRQLSIRMAQFLYALSQTTAEKSLVN